ncbi:MAG: hypothetical protein LBH44_01770 [Treponema sp.]|jgi:hypothetical protein|nr:hypothetical protein [Treponema sp.]
MKKYLTDFAVGIIVGFITAVIIFGCVAAVVYTRNKNKEIVEYAERQIEIEMLRENIVNCPADVFLKNPDVRRAADGARGEFDRKLTEILQRFRNRPVD